MKIISIDFHSSISEIIINDIDNFIKQNCLIKIYYWRFNNIRINCYVNIEDNILINNHILPPNGISDIFDIDSEKIEIENTIYMIGSLNNDFYDLTLENYGLFYFDSTEISSSEEDTIIETDIKTKTKNIVSSVKSLNINTNDTLDIDMNIY
tara:strand:+ start:183 stop:638 length:456 start_codon:yes stop_codon:yes gene_type:complete